MRNVEAVHGGYGSLLRPGPQVWKFHGFRFGKMDHRAPHVQNRDVTDTRISTGRGAYHHVHVEMLFIDGLESFE